MTMATSGTISIGGTDPARSINAQFGRASNATTSMSQLYRNAGIVGAGAPNVPTSGPISLSQFYGAANAFTFNATIASNTQDYNLRNAAIAAGWNGTIPLNATVTINSGVVVGASSTGVYAFDTGSSFPAGSSLSLINNGFIVGRGGDGGAGGAQGGSVESPGSPGGQGGPALLAQAAIAVTNNGTIGGGGGGGGGGGAARVTWLSCTNVCTSQSLGRVGGGGGGGRSSVFNSAGGPTGSGTGQPGATAGQAGTVSAPGAGGSGGSGNNATVTATVNAGAGGTGGGWGASGVGGAAGTFGGPNATGGNAASGGVGGGGGAAVVGNGNISWVATGTRLGAIT